MKSHKLLNTKISPKTVNVYCLTLCLCKLPNLLKYSSRSVCSCWSPTAPRLVSRLLLTERLVLLLTLTSLVGGV